MQPSKDVVASPVFAETTSWMLQDGMLATIVEAGDAMPVPNSLHRRRLGIAGILVTHERTHGWCPGVLTALRQ